MELTPKQQVIELIKKSSKILLLSHSNPDGDAFGSLLALYMVLKKLEKDVVAVIEDLKENFSFLPNFSELISEVKGSRDFIISLDIKEIKASKLSYNIEGDKLNIVISPQKGEFKPEDVSFSYGKWHFDLMIILDTADPEQLGKIYEENTHLFYEVPIINIDHHASNEYFGKVNLIDLTASSTCEILLGLIEALGKACKGSESALIDEDVATALLCGIITDTGSFQNLNTTPKSFTVAAQLIALGARQQEIVKNIYKKRSLTTLKLWGKILSKIKHDPLYRISWSVISKDEISEIGAQESEISGVIDELLTSVANSDIVLLLSERKDGIYGSIRTIKGVDATKLASFFNGGGHPEAAGFKITNASLEEALEKVLEKFKEFQKERLNLEELEKKKEVSEKLLEEKSVPKEEKKVEKINTEKKYPLLEKVLELERQEKLQDEDVE